MASNLTLEDVAAMAKLAKCEAQTAQVEVTNLKGKVAVLEKEATNYQEQLERLGTEVTNYEEQLERLHDDLSRVEGHIKPQQSGPYCSGGGSAVASREKDHRSAINTIACLLFQQIRDGLNGRPLTVTEAGKITKDAGLVLKNVANQMGIPPKSCDGKSQILMLLCHVFPYLAWEKKGIPTKNGGTHYEVELNFP